MSDTAGAVETDATEVYVGLSRDFMDGKFSASLTNYVVVSDDAWGFSNMDGETYTDLSVDVPIGSYTNNSFRLMLDTKHLVIKVMEQIMTTQIGK